MLTHSVYFDIPMIRVFIYDNDGNKKIVLLSDADLKKSAKITLFAFIK